MMAAAMSEARWTAPRRLPACAAGVALVLALGGWAWSAASVEARRVTLSIVGTTDLHGRVFGEDGQGGLELLGGYLANLRAARAADGGAVLLIDSGDTYQGGIESNLSEGALVVDAYNALDYTAAAIGNHDFEYGAVDAWDGAASDRDLRGALKARAGQARFPFLAANLIDDGTGRTVAWPNVRPSVVVHAAGVRVGIVGVMTAGALSMTLAANVPGLSVAPLAATIATEASALRAGGAEVVIVAAHAGGACTDFGNPIDLASCHGAAEMFEVVRALPRGLVDAVVAGHTHGAVAHEVNGVPIVQAHYWGQAFSRVDLTVDLASRRIETRRIHPPQEICARQARDDGRCVPASTPGSVEAHYEGRPVVAAGGVAEAMAPALQRVHALRAVRLGVELEAPVDRGNGAGESPLGNLYADALRAAVPGAAAAIGYSSGPGGLRAGLPAGSLTVGALYDTFPFDNRVVRAEVTGAELRTLVTGQLRGPRVRGRSLGVSGLHVVVDCRAGDFIADVTWASGQAVRDGDRIVLATIDFLTARLDRPLAATTTNLELREVARRWLLGRPGRLPIAEFADPAQPRWTRTASAERGCGSA
jgi:5'-nucleotidase